MKTLIILISLISNLALAQTYPTLSKYAPTYYDVVVLYDSAEKEFQPFFFYSILGETLDMKMDESCKKIRIDSVNQDLLVKCIASDSSETIAGSLIENSERNAEFELRRIKWSNNIELVQNVNPHSKELSYSIVVK